MGEGGGEGGWERVGAGGKGVEGDRGGGWKEEEGERGIQLFWLLQFLGVALTPPSPWYNRTG